MTIDFLYQISIFNSKDIFDSVRRDILANPAKDDAARSLAAAYLVVHRSLETDYGTLIVLSKATALETVGCFYAFAVAVADLMPQIVLQVFHSDRQRTGFQDICTHVYIVLFAAVGSTC